MAQNPPSQTYWRITMNKLIKAVVLALAMTVALGAKAAQPAYPDSIRPVTKYSNAELCQSLYTAYYHNHAQTLLDIAREFKTRTGITKAECETIAVMYENHIARQQTQENSRAAANQRRNKAFWDALQPGHRRVPGSTVCKPNIYGSVTYAPQ